jgi:hypothetical protein
MPVVISDNKMALVSNRVAATWSDIDTQLFWRASLDYQNLRPGCNFGFSYCPIFDWQGLVGLPERSDIFRWRIYEMQRVSLD